MSVGKNKIVVVGAGNVAAHLARRAAAQGFRVAQIVNRTRRAAEALAAEVAAEPISGFAQMDRTADFYLVAVKDDAIAGVLADFPRVGGIVAHTSGSTPVSVFADTEISRFGVLYPMQTFSKNRAVDFEKIPLFVEAGDEPTLEVLEAFARQLSPNVRRLTSERRRRLHLSAVFACNFANHMYALAEQTLREADLPFDILLPLISETSRKVSEMSPIEAQTGPAVRFDRRTIDSHLQLIGDEKIRQIYTLISENIHIFAEKTE